MALLNKRMTQRNRTPSGTAPERNEPGLDDLVSQVSNIFPTSRLDKKKNEVCVGSVPTEGPDERRKRKPDQSYREIQRSLEGGGE